MGKFDDFIELADELIGEFGGPVVWTKRVIPVPDPASPWIPVAERPPQQFPIQMALLPLNHSMLRTTLTAMASLGYTPDQQTKAGNAQGFISGSVPFIPALEDTVLIKGRPVKAGVVDILDPDMTGAILYLVAFQL